MRCSHKKRKIPLYLFDIAFPMRGGVIMFVTWDVLFLFAGFILALLTYIDNHNKKN